jgi:hypothetical protein
MDDRSIVGLIEEVTITSLTGKSVVVRARIDTGAENSSIDQDLAAELQLGPIIKTKVIRQSQGKSLRPVVEAKVSLAGKEMVQEFTISTRTHLRYKALIGQNVLIHGFLIDPNKNNLKKK